jgi:hypothetical protein
MRSLYGIACLLEQRKANEITRLHLLDTVEVIGSIPVAPIRFLNPRRSTAYPTPLIHIRDAQLLNLDKVSGQFL